jgi:prepilin-type N-terminal cleavage/methylation domain-containing protein
MTRSKTQGFTLIEAAVAIAVVAILSGIIVPLVVKNLNDARVARARNDVQVIAAAVASQLKDTGSRPSAAAGPNGASGVGQAVWASGPVGAAFYPTGVTATTAANLFTNLFGTAASPNTAMTLFGLPAVNANANAAQEFAYKGPYLGTDVAVKLDPWGSRYFILGYNATSQGVNGPIWIGSAGPNKSTTLPAVGATGYAGVWTVSAINSDDIVVRVN